MALQRRTDRIIPQGIVDELDTESPASLPPPAMPGAARDEPPPAEEIIIESATGRIRQAGADAEGAWLIDQRKRFEASLYAFTKGVLGRKLLSKHVHKWFCRSLTHPIPPYRRMRLIPRGHLKSSIVSEALPIHMHIQPDPADGVNLYWPGVPGSEMNTILAGEKKELMASHLRWIASQYESNKLLRGLWPHLCWDNPRRQSKKWNEDELILPRKVDYADPSIRVIGVDGAITGAHCRVLIKDDLVSLAAANSQTVMMGAIDWHTASRALLAPYEETGLEYIIGTRWAVSDLYSHIMDNDPTVDHITRAIVEDGVPIWPEQITLASVEALRKEHGVRFHLFYMNNVQNSDLVDFSMDDLRWYAISGGDTVVLEEDHRDAAMRQRAVPVNVKPTGTSERYRGQRFTPDLQREMLSGRDTYLRLKAR